MNSDASLEKCATLLESLNTVIRNKYDNKMYDCCGGYDIYSKDLDEVIRKYREASEKGATSAKILSEFLLKKKSEIDKIVALDREMSSRKVREEVDSEAENVRTELEEKHRAELREKDKLLEEKMSAAKLREEEMQKSLEKMKEILKEQRKYELLITERLKVQEQRNGPTEK